MPPDVSVYFDFKCASEFYVYFGDAVCIFEWYIFHSTFSQSSLMLKSVCYWQKQDAQQE